MQNFILLNLQSIVPMFRANYSIGHRLCYLGSKSWCKIFASQFGQLKSDQQEKLHVYLRFGVDCVHPPATTVRIF